MTGAPILLERDEGPVRILSLNRPKRKNALNTALCEALVDAVRRAGDEESPRAIVLTGEGGAFCSGADTKEFPNPLGALKPDFERRTRLLAELQQALVACEKPLVAACDGPAIGAGASLMMCCDLAVASPGMRLGFPEFRHGILPAMVLATLHRALPGPAAFRLIALGELLTAQAAQALGLLSHLTENETALSQAVALAQTLAEIDPALYARGKALFRQTAGASFEEALRLGEAATVAARE